MVTCNIGPRGWFAASHGGIQELLAHRPLLVFIQDARITRARATSKNFKKHLAWVAPGYRAFVSASSDRGGDDQREYSLASMTLVHSTIMDRVKSRPNSPAG